jgi:hypothetical protein
MEEVGGRGGEMTQTLYAHMNKRNKMYNISTVDIAQCNSFVQLIYTNKNF